MARAAARVVDADRRAPPSNGNGAKDPLTGLPTTDALDHRVAQEAQRAKRYSLSFSLVLLDVDQQDGLVGAVGERSGTLERRVQRAPGHPDRGIGAGLASQGR